MSFRLLKHIGHNPNEWRLLLGLLFFRKVRDQFEYSDCSFEEHIVIAARQAKVSESALHLFIERWMFVEPLSLIGRCPNRDALRLWEEWQAKGMNVYVYSDYRAEKKLEILGLEADEVFYPSDSTFRGLKPSIEAMNYILSSVPFKSGELVFIGDRAEKDGESARLAGIQYIDVKKL